MGNFKVEIPPSIDSIGLIGMDACNILVYMPCRPTSFLTSLKRFLGKE
jgi:hypothetical protein